MSSEKDPKYIHAQEHKLYCYYNHFEGTEIIKTEKKKMTTKQFEEYFRTKAVRKRQQTLKWQMASRFSLVVYSVLLFDSHFSFVYFSGLKYILLRQIVHFSP